MRRAAARFFTHYGMVGVLLILCGYFSWATYGVQQPRGSAAGRLVARQIAREFQPPARVLVVARATEDDRAFLGTVSADLRGRGFVVEEASQIDPRTARLALQNLAEAGTRLAAIGTTAECAAWKVLADASARWPGLGEPRLVHATPYRWPTFLKADNLLNVGNQIVVVAIIAVGMTLVIITGGIDLSVGSLIALSAVVATLLIRDVAGGPDASPASMVWCSAAGIAAGGVTGLFSGTMITLFRIPPFIATLAVMQIANGLAYILTRGSSVYELPETYTWLGRGIGVFSIPHTVFLMGVLYAAAHVLMKHTALGRYIYAIGGNAEAARLSGIDNERVLRIVYTISGALAGLGGVITASQLKSGSPTYGVAYELYVIAAVVVGGTSLSGGSGKVFGTLIGALIIAVIQNGMNLTGVESYPQKVVLGALILAAVLLDQLKRRRWR